MTEAEPMTDAQIRTYILGRFKLKSALESNGRVAKTLIWGSGSKRPPGPRFRARAQGDARRRDTRLYQRFLVEA